MAVAVRPRPSRNPVPRRAGIGTLQAHRLVSPDAPGPVLQSAPLPTPLTSLTPPPGGPSVARRTPRGGLRCHHSSGLPQPPGGTGVVGNVQRGTPVADEGRLDRGERSRGKTRWSHPRGERQVGVHPCCQSLIGVRLEPKVRKALRPAHVPRYSTQGELLPQERRECSPDSGASGLCFRVGPGCEVASQVSSRKTLLRFAHVQRG